MHFPGGAQRAVAAVHGRRSSSKVSRENRVARGFMHKFLQKLNGNNSEFGKNDQLYSVYLYQEICL